jgi:hypothetical protein
LPRRTPAAHDASAPGRVDDRAVLAALGRYAPEAAAPHQGTPDPRASPLAPPDALTRRVKGAQLPPSAVVSLRGGRVDPPPRRADVPTPGASKATDVQSLLTSFTAGVQRGLEDARRRASGRTSGPVPVVGPGTPPWGHDHG